MSRWKKSESSKEEHLLDSAGELFAYVRRVGARVENFCYRDGFKSESTDMNQVKSELEDRLDHWQALEKLPDSQCPDTLRDSGAQKCSCVHSLKPDQIETILEALDSDAEYWRTIAEPTDMARVAKINEAREAFRAMTEGAP